VQLSMAQGLPKIDILKCRGKSGETTQAVRLRA